MAFELWTDGIRLVDRIARVFNKHDIARDPLSGVVDGINQVYYSNFNPILSSGSTLVYTTGSAPLASSDYTVAYDSGTFVFNSAPSVQPKATYSIASYPDSVIKSLLIAGFDEMEGRWYRGLYLTDTLNTVSLVTEDSLFAYIVNSSGSDPVLASGVTFSQSRAQLNFYAKCVQLAFYLTLMGEHALTDFIWAEYQGLRVDKSKNVPNLNLAYNALLKQMTTYQNAAAAEYYGSAAWGGVILSPMTREFAAHRYWQKASLAEDWRGTTPYTGQLY